MAWQKDKLKFDKSKFGNPVGLFSKKEITRIYISTKSSINRTTAEDPKASSDCYSSRTAVDEKDSGNINIKAVP